MFYGWVILAVGAIGGVMTSPGQTYAFSAFLDHFINDLGLGLQFAAVAGLVYRKAVEAGIGHELPTDWFTEDVHP